MLHALIIACRHTVVPAHPRDWYARLALQRETEVHAALLQGQKKNLNSVPCFNSVVWIHSAVCCPMNESGLCGEMCVSYVWTRKGSEWWTFLHLHCCTKYSSQVADSFLASLQFLVVAELLGAQLCGEHRTCVRGWRPLSPPFQLGKQS